MCGQLVPTMPDISSCVKMLVFLRTLLVVIHVIEHLWMLLWKNRKNLISHSLSNHGSMGCISES